MNDEIPNLTSCTKAFEKSIGAEQIDIASEYAELAIDKILDESIDNYSDTFESIPIVKTGYTVFRLYKGFSTRHYLKKLIAFINQFNAGIATTEDINWYKEKFSERNKGETEHVEYLLTLIDRYVGCDKPRMLAILFIAFLDDRLSWNELTSFSEVLDKFLPGDYEVLWQSNTCNHNASNIPSAILRLVGLGLMVESNRPNVFVPRENGNLGITYKSLSAVAKNEIEYSRTAFGNKLVSIIQNNYATK